MKRIGFITDAIEIEEPLSRVLKKFDGQGEVQIETINRLSPDIPVINKVLSLIRMCDIVVFFVAKGAANIYYEIGLAQALNKKVVLMTNSHNLIPIDLAYQTYIVVEDENFEGVAYEIYKALDYQSIHEALYWHPDESNSIPYESYFNEFSPTLKFRDLYAFSGSKRRKLFEAWFVALAKNVKQWEVIEAAETKKSGEGFDLMIWNSADDPDLRILGNPIPIELKALNSMNSSQIDLLASKLRKQGLRSLILLTTGTNRTSAVGVANKIKKKYEILIVALDRDDLIDIESPKDLYLALKRQLLNIAYRE